MFCTFGAIWNDDMQYIHYVQLILLMPGQSSEKYQSDGKSIYYIEGGKIAIATSLAHATTPLEVLKPHGTHLQSDQSTCYTDSFFVTSN
jgi:hypothetical protein